MTYRSYERASEIAKELFALPDEATLRLELVKVLRKLGPITSVDLLEMFVRAAIERHADYEDFQHQVAVLLEDAHLPRG